MSKIKKEETGRARHVSKNARFLSIFRIVATEPVSCPPRSNVLNLILPIISSSWSIDFGVVVGVFRMMVRRIKRVGMVFSRILMLTLVTCKLMVRRLRDDVLLVFVEENSARC